MLQYEVTQVQKQQTSTRKSLTDIDRKSVV